MWRIIGSILIGADELVGEMVRSRIPYMRESSWGPFTTLGVVKDGVLVGGVVYHDYRGFNCQISAAFDKPWACRSTLRALGDYPFNQLGCIRLTMVIGRKNKKAKKIANALGFTLEGVLKRGLDGSEDAFIWGLLKDDCRWIKERNNGPVQQAESASTRAA